MFKDYIKNFGTKHVGNIIWFAVGVLDAEVEEGDGDLNKRRVLRSHERYT